MIAALLFTGVAASALWSGWSHSDDPVTGPAPITLHDVIVSRGGAPGSVSP